jgi:4-deoxy-L-threo-5-hexosulose-uronate ketol-isomerase
MKTNIQLRYAAHPDDVKSWGTEQLRKEHLVTPLFEDNTVNMVYTLYDRMVAGGAKPAGEPLRLEPVDEVKAAFFLHRREIGIFNVGGAGKVTAGDKAFDLKYKEALYLGSGDREVIFESLDLNHPALFYFNSATAHRNYPDRKVTGDDCITAELGSMEAANHRIIKKMIVREVLETCQLQMGMTGLKPGSVWNTMPPHTHGRRMEVYFYFEVPEGNAVCHFMGQPSETRHIWMKNNEAVLSPQWSIHAATATSNYTFIWGMAGENLDYGDQDFFKQTDLR